MQFYLIRNMRKCITEVVFYDSMNLEYCGNDTLKRFIRRLKESCEPMLGNEEKIMEIIESHPILTFNDFLCCSGVAVQLLSYDDKSINQIKLNKLLKHIYIGDLDQFVSDLCIHSAASVLFQFLKDDLNLIRTVQNISHYNRFSFYVGLSLTWAALYRFVGIDIKDFRLHKFTDLEQILNKTTVNVIDDRNNFHRFLLLISLLQNSLLLRSHLEQNTGFEQYLVVDKQDVQNILVTWLRNVKILWEEKILLLNEFDEANLEIIETNELLTVDILPLFDDYMSLDLES